MFRRKPATQVEVSSLSSSPSCDHGGDGSAPGPTSTSTPAPTSIDSTTTKDDGKKRLKQKHNSAKLIILCLVFLPILWSPFHPHFHDTHDGETIPFPDTTPASRPKLLQLQESETALPENRKHKFVPPTATANATTPTSTSTSPIHVPHTSPSNPPSRREHHDGLPDYHIVFSTGCSASQAWQSYAFFYHAYKSGQRGKVTRIASGCTPAQEQRMRVEHVAFIQSTMSQDFYLHFTPDYSKKSINSDQLKYPYFNKPFGMLHWMEHALGYYKHDDFANTTSSIPTKQPSNNPNDDTIIFLLDPDQILLRPLTHDFSKNIPPDDDDMKWVARRKKLNNTAKIVQHRTTIAQQYGYGGQWLSKVNLEKVLPPRSDKSEDQKPPSPLWKLNVMTAKKFAAGPPYIATARDMYAIVHTWADFVPRVHDDCPTLLAEMFAYNLAAHHIHRQPYTSPGFMVSSDVEDVTEAWYRIDDYFNKNTFTSSSSNNNNNNFCARQYPPLIDDHHHPFVLHYCQQYKWEGSMFLKYVMPGKFFTCTSDLLQEPNYDSWIVNASTVRSAYMICTLIPALNEAATFYKQHHCRTINTTNGNATSTAGGGRSTSKKVSFDKKLVLVESAGFKKQREKKSAATAPVATKK